MNIPKYWAKAEQTIAIGRQTFHFVAWKGSDESLQDAQRQAQVALADRIARKERGEKLGQYPKDGAPLREEVLEQIFNPSGERIAVITRNAAGCLVLNTARVMFVDLDFANQYPTLRAAAKSFWEAVGGMFRRPTKAVKTQTPQDQLLEQVRNWHSQHPDWAMRVYRTRAGLRLLVAHDVFDPTSALVQQAMRELGADMRYMRLCQAQSCFRARLTPKPWRLKGGRMERPPVRFPWASAQEEALQRQWERTYQGRIGNFAVCTLLANLGHSPVHPDAEQILLLHDQYTLSQSDKPLA
ncbi:hypothetical protein [Meiothermus sp.]|uniref:hypothetical protein n=1 Tax=Meiothermus sp. TaxID=1955249 RepID=UPI00307DCCEE